jgi:hypothetical protein
MLLSLGGIPGARESNYNSVKDLGTDRAAWANETKTLGNELKAEAAKTRASYQKIIDVAKEFRYKLKGQEDGVGAIEIGFSLELRELIQKDALELSELGFKERGPVVARAIDTKTGQMSQRYVNVKEVPADLDPILRDRINKLNELGQEKHHSKPGTHAEILAVDELLKARRAAGETVTEKTLNDIITDQYWLDVKTDKPNNGINPAPTCGNCTEILKGTTSQAGANE